MIIFFSGLIGTGKTSLSKEVARNLGIYHYDLDELKKEIYPKETDFDYRMKNGIPASDETRMKVFRKAEKQLIILSKTHRHIIVDETLHKENTRRILFDVAEKYFGGYILFEITSLDATVKERLEMKREGHILTNPYKMYLSFKRMFEPFTEKHITYENNKSIDHGVKFLSKIILKEI